MKRAVVGLGSNLGDRGATLAHAVRSLEGIATVAACSRVYETRPVGGPPQSDFLNAAVLLQWAGSARALLEALQRIEHELGRVRNVRWGPRTLDLDILWVEDTAIEEADLIVPHPRLTERAFAWMPFMDVAPDVTDPRTHRAFVWTGSSSDVTPTELALR